MLRSLAVLFVSLTVFFAPLTAAAKEFKGTTSGLSLNASPELPKLPQFSFSVAWTYWTLFGEPVFNGRLKWAYDDTALININSGGQTKSLQWASIKKKAPGQAAILFDVTVRLRGKSDATGLGSGEIIFDMDMGVPKNSGGDWSFNVPTSMDWDDLPVYWRLSGTQDGVRGEVGRRLTADEAKRFFSNDFSVRKATIVKAEINTVGLANWAAKASGDVRVAEAYLDGAIAQLEAAQRRFKNGINVAGAIQEAKLQRSFSSGSLNTPSMIREREASAKALWEKVQRGWTRENFRPGEYEKHVAERQAIAAEVDTTLRRLTQPAPYLAWLDAKQKELAARKLPEGQASTENCTREWLGFGEAEDPTVSYFGCTIVRPDFEFWFMRNPYRDGTGDHEDTGHLVIAIESKSKSSNAFEIMPFKVFFANGDQLAFDRVSGTIRGEEEYWNEFYRNEDGDKDYIKSISQIVLKINGETYTMNFFEE